MPFVPLMPFVDAYVTNGGFGGVVIALANGVPVVSAGTTEDKAEVGGRVAYAGVGINLKTNRPTEDALRVAIFQVLRDPSYREKAARIQRDFADHDAPTEAAELLEQLASTKAPVIRTGPIRACLTLRRPKGVQAPLPCNSGAHTWGTGSAH